MVPSGCVFAHWDRSTQTPRLAFLSFLPFAAGSPLSTNILETLVTGKREATVPKLNVKIKNDKKVRKAAEGCPSMPESVGLRGVVAAVTQQGAGSQVKGKGPLQDLTAGWRESAVAT